MQRQLKEQGLVLADVDGDRTDLFYRAEELIAFTPSLALRVASLVNELHLISADPGYDVSHSEPCWQSRIFVSLPDRSDDVGALRLAESVVHEAMHLNLTLFEMKHPIIADPEGTMASPWRPEARPYQGVAHGLFVFACLGVYFDELRRSELGTVTDHIQQRIADIRSEIASINVIELSRGLTQVGRSLATSWHAAATAFP